MPSSAFSAAMTDRENRPTHSADFALPCLVDVLADLDSPPGSDAAVD